MRAFTKWLAVHESCRIRASCRFLLSFMNEDGRLGHYGLPGMREHAQLLGGTLTVWTGLNKGTVLELSIPASNAYAMNDSAKRSPVS